MPRHISSNITLVFMEPINEKISFNVLTAHEIAVINFINFTQSPLENLENSLNLFSNIAAVMFSSIEQSNGSGIVTFQLSIHQPICSSYQ